MLILGPLSTKGVFYSTFQMDPDKWQGSDNINITSNPVEAALADIVTVPVPPPSLQTYDTVQVRFAQATVPDQVVPTNQDVSCALPANLVVETYPVCILEKKYSQVSY